MIFHGTKEIEYMQILDKLFIEHFGLEEFQRLFIDYYSVGEFHEWLAQSNYNLNETVQEQVAIDHNESIVHVEDIQISLEQLQVGDPDDNEWDDVYE